tara:strand:+ start:3540 stop:3956 length:417 start_codon:yes stop_codon:yes gene_type:complete
LIKKISDKDKKDWEAFLSGDEKIIDKDLKKQEKLNIKTTTIDLHGYSLEDANKTIEEFIKSSYEKKINKIVVVTGKGLHSDNKQNPYVSKDLSILKYSVPDFIIRNVNLMKYISDIKEAKIEDGGSGAFYLFLKKNIK